MVVGSALLLAGFGLWSLRHDRIIALHDARATAQAHAAKLAASIQRGLMEPILPSRADVDAFVAEAGAADREPLSLLDPDGLGTLALLVHPDGSFPTLAVQFTLPPPLEPMHLPLEARDAWWAAESLELSAGGPQNAVNSWQAFLARSSALPWESNVRFRLGRCLLALGRTSEARECLEAVAAAPQKVAGVTGLPLDVLAFRGLLQITEVDPTAVPHRGRWLDGLCQRVLLTWRLSPVLVEEWESMDPLRVRQWRAVGARHEAARAAFGRLPDLAMPSPGTGPGLEPGWIEYEGQHWLLSSHAASGGTWFLLRPEGAVHAAVNAASGAGTLPLPEYLGRRVVTFNQPLSRADASAATAVEAMGEPLATARQGGVEVGIHMEKPDLLLGRQRFRTQVFGSLIALGAVAVVGGFIAVLRAYEHQRRYAQLQGDFVASVSHELRAPLGSIRLMAEELTDLPPTMESRRASYHDLILRETRRLGLLIENVLRHARLEHDGKSLTHEMVDLAEIVRLTLESVRPAAMERELVLDARVPQESVNVRGDSQALQQVLVNLLDNAFKHSPQGATVTVGVEAQDAAVDSKRACARVWVADQGPGIPAEEHQRIFQSFYRRGTELRRETAGIGLGLAIVKRLVALHGGTVRVSSSTGTGCCFSIELPCCECDAAGKRERDVPEARPGAPLDSKRARS